MIVYRAAWILPVTTPPLRDGWLAVHEGRIIGVGSGPGPSPADERDLGDVVLMPGLVNAHTHLELSYLRNQVPPADTFISWIRGVMAARRQRPDPQSSEIVTGVQAGIDEAVRCGTAVVGDISNTLVTIDPLRASPVAAVVFYELIRFNAPDPVGLVRQACDQIDRAGTADEVTASLAAHAPYSVAPGVFRAIRDAIDARPRLRCSVHLAEAREEIEFIATGDGAWRLFLQEIGSWDPAWTPPGGSPVAFLDETGFLDPRVLAVHGVQMTPHDLERLAVRGTTLVACPRSNQYTGAGAAPIEAFYKSGVRVAVGTDSLSSCPDLNLFAELAAMRELAPSVRASALLASATIEGARALGCADDYGSLEPGKRSRVLGVRVTPALGDVEEYLVAGVTPDRLFWVDDRTLGSPPS